MKSYNKLWILLAICSWYGCPSATLDDQQKAILAHEDAWVVRTYAAKNQIQAGETLTVECLVTNKGNAVSRATHVKTDTVDAFQIVEQTGNQAVIAAKKAGHYHVRCVIDELEIEDLQGMNIEVTPGAFAKLQLTTAHTEARAGDLIPYGCRQLDDYDNEINAQPENVHVCAPDNVSVIRQGENLAIEKAGKHQVSCCLGRNCCADVDTNTQITSNFLTLDIQPAQAVKLALNLSRDKVYETGETISGESGKNLYELFDRFGNPVKINGAQMRLDVVDLQSNTRPEFASTSNHVAFSLQEPGYYSIRPTVIVGDGQTITTERTILVCPQSVAVANEQLSNNLDLRFHSTAMLQQVLQAPAVSPNSDTLLAEWTDNKNNAAKILWGNNALLNWQPNVSTSRTEESACHVTMNLPAQEQNLPIKFKYPATSIFGFSEQAASLQLADRTVEFGLKLENHDDVLQFRTDPHNMSIVKAGDAPDQRYWTFSNRPDWWHTRSYAQLFADDLIQQPLADGFANMVKTHIDNSIKKFVADVKTSKSEQINAEMSSGLRSLQCSEQDNHSYVDAGFAVSITDKPNGKAPINSLAACRPAFVGGEPQAIEPSLLALSDNQDFAAVVQDDVIRQMLWTLWTKEEFQQDTYESDGIRIQIIDLLPPMLLAADQDNLVRMAVGDVRIKVTFTKAVQKAYWPLEYLEKPEDYDIPALKDAYLYASGVFAAKIGLHPTNHQFAWQFVADGAHALRLYPQDSPELNAYINSAQTDDLRGRLERSLSTLLSAGLSKAFTQMSYAEFNFGKLLGFTNDLEQTPTMVEINRPANAGYTIVKGQFSR